MCENRRMPFLFICGDIRCYCGFGAFRCPGRTVLGNRSGTINQLSHLIVSGGEARLAGTTADLRIPSLTNCNTIDTDSNGVFACGDATGGGVSGSISSRPRPTLQTPRWFTQPASIRSSQMCAVIVTDVTCTWSAPLGPDRLRFVI
jgi:hypothetical protein